MAGSSCTGITGGGWFTIGGGTYSSVDIGRLVSGIVGGTWVIDIGVVGHGVPDVTPGWLSAVGMSDKPTSDDVLEAEWERLLADFPWRDFLAGGGAMARLANGPEEG